jgi:hypothetical protein
MRANITDRGAITPRFKRHGRARHGHDDEEGAFPVRCSLNLAPMGLAPGINRRTVLVEIPGSSPICAKIGGGGRFSVVMAARVAAIHVFGATNKIE